jgi:hypothetical protein
VFIPLDQVKDPHEIFNKIKQRKVGIDTLIRVSLNEIIVKARSASRDPNKFQTYIKYDAALSSSLDGEPDVSADKSQPDLGDMFIVKVLDLTFNDKECMLINFIDITMYQRLQYEE